MSMPPRSLLPVLLVAALAACGGADPVLPLPEPLGEATVTVHDPEGTVTFSHAEAAFYVYANGPSPDDRAMYLALGGSRGGESIEIIFFQFLPQKADSPEPGSYGARYGAMGGDPTMGGDILRRRGSRMNQLFPVEAKSTVTLEEVSTERIRGHISLVILENHPAADPEVHLEATFEAVRSPYFEDLPRPVSHPRR